MALEILSNCSQTVNQVVTIGLSLKVEAAGCRRQSFVTKRLRRLGNDLPPVAAREICDDKAGQSGVNTLKAEPKDARTG